MSSRRKLLVLMPVLVLACGRLGGSGRVPEVDPVARRQACEALCVHLDTSECVSSCKKACADPSYTGKDAHGTIIQIDCNEYVFNVWVVDDPDGGV